MKIVLTQQQKVLKALSKGALTPKYARTTLKIMKPSARICELRDNGVLIESFKNRAGNFAWKLPA
jgi:hypothetical protein